MDINEMIACVRREIKKREFVYPRLIEQGKLSPKKADSEIVAMKSVLHILSELKVAMSMNDDQCRQDIFSALLIDSRPKQEQGDLFKS